MCRLIAIGRLLLPRPILITRGPFTSIMAMCLLSVRLTIPLSGLCAWGSDGLFDHLIICWCVAPAQILVRSMAQYEHLPIYKQALDLAVYLEKAVSGFSRYHKYILGADLWRIARCNIGLIIRANSETERLATLILLRSSLEELMVCLRIAKELQIFKGLNSFIYALEQTLQLSRQNEGWIKSLKKLPEQPDS